MKQTREYLHSIFGSNMLMEEYHSYDALPMYLCDNYQLCKLELSGDPYIMAKPKDGIKVNVSSIQKQFLQIEKHTHLKPVLVTDGLRLSQRNALIQAGVAFIIPRKQIYIPKFIINLSEIQPRYESYKNTFGTATQVVYIYLLLHRITETNAHRLCEELDYSVATINRALKELCYRKLLYTAGNATRKIYFIKDIREYWNNGKKYLFDPVKARCYVSIDFDHSKLKMSNDLALSRLSNLAGRSVCYYALCAREYNNIDKSIILNEYDVFEHNYCIIEKFIYDPKLLSKGAYIDAISLYAQFKDTQDERIQIEIEDLVKALLW